MIRLYRATPYCASDVAKRLIRSHLGAFRCAAPVLESGQTVFMNARHAGRRQQSSAGLLRDSPVLSCARRVQRPSDPQVFDQFVTNRIKQLPYGLICEIRGLCSRAALTRRMSAVRARQHPPESSTCARLSTPCPLFVHYFGAAFLQLEVTAASGLSALRRNSFAAHSRMTLSGMNLCSPCACASPSGPPRSRSATIAQPNPRSLRVDAWPPPRSFAPRVATLRYQLSRLRFATASKCSSRLSTLSPC